MKSFDTSKLLRHRVDKKKNNLDPNKIERHANHFKLNTFGVRPSGENDQINANTIMKTDNRQELLLKFSSQGQRSNIKNLFKWIKNGRIMENLQVLMAFQLNCLPMLMRTWIL